MEDFRSAIAETGGILKGKFFFALATEGFVSCEYVNLDPTFTYPGLVRRFSQSLYAPFRGRVDVLAAPATGAIPLLYAGLVNERPSFRTVWADKKPDGTFAFERMGFLRAVRNKRVAVLEDISSSGKTTRALVKLVEKAGGVVVGVSLIWNRGGITAEKLGVPKLHSLIEETIPTWEAGEHPEWGKWPLVADVGHPEHFPNYPGERILLAA